MSSAVSAGKDASANSKKLSTWAANTMQGIKDAIDDKESQFEADVNSRVRDLSNSFKGILLPPAEEMTQGIEGATTTYGEDVKKRLDGVLESKAIYQLK